MRTFLLRCLRMVVIILSCMTTYSVLAQETVYGVELAEPFGDVDISVNALRMDENLTQLTLAVRPHKPLPKYVIYHSPNTYIVGEDGTKLPILGIENEDGIESTGLFRGELFYPNFDKTNFFSRYSLVFCGRLPEGVTKWSLIDQGDGRGHKGYCAYNMYANNPKTNTPKWTESRCKANINANNDGICGIYEEITDTRQQQFAVIKDGGSYKMVYVGAKFSPYSWWLEGDKKADLRGTATIGIYKADWIGANKLITPNCYVKFDGLSMEATVNKKTLSYIKTYPTAIPEEKEEEITDWTGTGFALNNGYIVTNHHVAAKAKTIKVQGIKGSFSIKYNAEVVAMDEASDLAILKIRDKRFTGFGTIPYSIKTAQAEVGEGIFVLGYPLTQTMGNEVKLTNGIISSRTGFQGDTSSYQMSAPIQPGNSGGPLFDNRGNVIGIVNAHHGGAENASYAIKAARLRSLLETYSLPMSILPGTNTIAAKSLPEKVKAVKGFVFYITCSSK